MPCLFIFADTWSTFFFFGGGKGVTSILEGMELTSDAFAIHKEYGSCLYNKCILRKGPNLSTSKTLGLLEV